jgi:hypothetical protein
MKSQHTTHNIYDPKSQTLIIRNSMKNNCPVIIHQYPSLQVH